LYCPVFGFFWDRVTAQESHVLDIVSHLEDFLDVVENDTRPYSRKRKRERQRETEKARGQGETETERERQRQRQTERERRQEDKERQRERESDEGKGDWKGKREDKERGRGGQTEDDSKIDCQWNHTIRSSTIPARVRVVRCCRIKFRFHMLGDEGDVIEGGIRVHKLWRKVKRERERGANREKGGRVGGENDGGRERRDKGGGTEEGWDDGRSGMEGGREEEERGRREGEEGKRPGK
jgi:hypothetical protein